MDKSIPLPAAKLLDFIGDTEVGRKPPEAYEVIFGHNQDKLTKKITKMTLEELIEHQKGFTRSFGSSASGRYQFMRETLKGLVAEMNLSWQERFTPDLQDQLGFHLLLRRGYSKFMLREMSLIAFGKLLAQEWASFPVLANTQGAHRWVERGQSYYAGDGLNKALVKPETVERVLGIVLDGEGSVPPVPTPKLSLWQRILRWFGIGD